MHLTTSQRALRLGGSALLSFALVGALAYCYAAEERSLDVFWRPGILLTLPLGRPHHSPFYLPLSGRVVYIQDAIGNFVFYGLLFFGLITLLFRTFSPNQEAAPNQLPNERLQRSPRDGSLQ